MSRRSATARNDRWSGAILAGFLLAGALASAIAGNGDDGASLPRLGPAPAFTLTDQDGRRFSSADQRGKVAVVTFIFAGCSDTCPLLTAKLVDVQRRLRREARGLVFEAITVDPLNDTPDALKKYARTHSVDLSNFAFLTGTPAQVDEVARRYAVFHRTQGTGAVEHVFLTSLVDRDGILRLQYLGTKFDTAEFEGDLRALLAEPAR